MRGHLIEEALSFKGLAPLQTTGLTHENKTGTLCRLDRRLSMMIAALGTLPFLATLWLLVVLGAAVLEESGAKIAAALKGDFGEQSSLPAALPRARSRRATQRISRATRPWLAAA